MADVGLRVRSESGYVETTVTTRLTKIIGSYRFPLYNPVNSNNKWVAPPEANGGLMLTNINAFFNCFKPNIAKNKCLILWRKTSQSIFSIFVGTCS